MVYNNNINTDGSELNVTPPKSTRNPIVAGAIIGAGASILGKAIDLGTSKSQIQKQYENNMDMWRTASNWDDYATQVRRMVDAGLNPNLMFDKGSLIQSGQPSAVDSGVGSSTFGSIGQDLAQIPQTALQVKQQSLLSRELDIKQQEANTHYADYEVKKELAESNIKVNEADFHRLVALRQKTEAERDNLNLTWFTLAQQIEQNGINIQKSYKDLEIYLKHQEDYVVARIKNMDSNTELNKVNAKYAPMFAKAARTAALAAYKSAEAAERNSFINDFNSGTEYQMAQIAYEDLMRRMKDSDAYRGMSDAQKKLYEENAKYVFWNTLNNTAGQVINFMEVNGRNIHRAADMFLPWVDAGNNGGSLFQPVGTQGFNQGYSGQYGPLRP